MKKHEEFMEGRTQLRALRWVLGTDFKSISLKALCDLIDISYISIVGIENLRRKLNDDDRLTIEILLGAVWNAQRVQWVTAWDRSLAYDRAQYDHYRSKLLFNRDIIKKDLDNFCKVVRDIVDGLEPREAHLFLLRQYRQLPSQETERGVISRQ